MGGGGLGAFTLIVTVSTLASETRMVPRLPGRRARDHWSKCLPRSSQALSRGLVPGVCSGAVSQGAGLSSCSRESSSCYLELSRGARGVGRGPTVVGSG